MLIAELVEEWLQKLSPGDPPLAQKKELVLNQAVAVTDAMRGALRPHHTFFRPMHIMRNPHDIPLLNSRQHKNRPAKPALRGAQNSIRQSSDALKILQLFILFTAFLNTSE